MYPWSYRNQGNNPGLLSLTWQDAFPKEKCTHVNKNFSYEIKGKITVEYALNKWRNVSLPDSVNNLFIGIGFCEKKEFLWQWGEENRGQLKSKASCALAVDRCESMHVPKEWGQEPLSLEDLS